MGFCLLLLVNSLHFPAVTGYQSITKKDREVFRLILADLFPSDFMNMCLDCERTIQTPQKDPTSKQFSCFPLRASTLTLSPSETLSPSGRPNTFTNSILNYSLRHVLITTY